MITENSQRQAQFEAILFQYLWIFSISGIVIASLIQFYLTKKLTRPLRKLIESTKAMKAGEYPDPLEVKEENEVGQLITHFNDLVEQLKMNEEHRKKLVSDLSHEFRTPLSNLNGYLKALHHGVIEPDPKLYESLSKETGRLTQMVEQMEQLKEWDYISKQTFSEKEPRGMRLMAEQVEEMFRWELKKAGIDVEVHVQSSNVNVSEGSILQVISNFLDNAIRYYEGKGPIIIKGKELEQEYMLSVTGPSQTIPVEEQEKIFERFYRSAQTGTQYLGGTGLGLTISKEIIQHHEGKIGVKTQNGQNTFWFTLPLD